MPRVTANIDDLSDASEVAHDEPLPIPVASTPAKNGTEEASDSSDEGDDEFQVEAIRSHTFDKKVLKYEIKWVGYSNDENTWEPVDNLLPDARDILSAYHKKIGYDPATQTPKTGKQASGAKRGAPSTDRPSTSKKVKTDKVSEEVNTWLPPKHDWEPFVKEVAHIERDAKTDALIVYVHWINGKKTKVSMSQVYTHCPRPMLRFYEKHLKFTSVE